MSELTPELVADVIAACQAGADEAAGALSRSLDNEFTLAVGGSGTYSSDTAPDGFDGPGLAVLFKFGDVGFAALLPEASGLLPDWYTSPDPTGESKLSTLAQELSMLLVPETLMADTFEAAHVESIKMVLGDAGVADGTSLVTLQLTSGDNSGQLSLLWPLPEPDAVFPASEQPEPEPAPAPKPATAAPPSVPLDFSGLPPYSKSLLRIQVPVRVVLASKKETVGEVVELSPGSIMKFDKSCEELLHLFVGDQLIADGEAVKVGEKFGFRVSTMQMPQEHFMRVPPKNAG